MTSCNMCGKCCYYPFKGKLKKCKHLVRKNGKTLCRIYKKRLGTVIDFDKETGQKILCIMREDSPIDYEGCPYNTNKPMVKF